MSGVDFNAIVTAHAAAMLRPSELTRDQWTYKGWQIGFDMPPIPIRDFDWSATHPDYDASYEGEEDGWVGSGGHVNAATYEELLAQIDTWEAIAEDDAREEAAAHGQFGVGA